MFLKRGGEKGGREERGWGRGGLQEQSEFWSHCSRLLNWLGYHGCKTSLFIALGITYVNQGFHIFSNLVIVSISIAIILAWDIALFILFVTSFSDKLGDFQAFASVCFAAVRSCRISLNCIFDTLSGFRFSSAILGSRRIVFSKRMLIIWKISDQNDSAFEL